MFTRGRFAPSRGGLGVMRNHENTFFDRGSKFFAYVAEQFARKGQTRRRARCEAGQVLGVYETGFDRLPALAATEGPDRGSTRS